MKQVLAQPLLHQRRVVPQQARPPRRYRSSQPANYEQHVNGMIQHHHLAEQMMALQVRQAAWPQREPDARMQDGRVQPLPSAWRVNYELGPYHELGGGAFAEVFRVRHKLTQQNVAIKVMHRPNFAMRGIECQITAEIKAMEVAAKRSDELKEDLHILKLLETAEEGEYVYLMLELCEQGDLLRRLGCEAGQRLPEDEVSVIARQLLIGLSWVHELGFIHRDIKPDNLLLHADGKLRIADFGWCCLRADHPQCLAGTLLYMAPELLRNEPQDVEVDVWSAGMTLYQLLVGRPLLQTHLGPGVTRLSEHDPHAATHLKQKWLLQEIDATCPPAMESKPGNVSRSCWDFIQRTLTVKREARIGISAALEHEWMKKAEQLQREREAGLAVMKQDSAPQSPPVKPKPWKVASPSKDISVPTPERPRSFDPHRNFAFTPPVSPELKSPERTDLGQESIPDFPLDKENCADPEVTHSEHKWSSPKDDLTEGSHKLKGTIAKLASPQRGRTKSGRHTIGGRIERAPKEETQPRQEDLSMDRSLAKLHDAYEEEGAQVSSVKLPVPIFHNGCLKNGDLLGASARHQHRIVGRFPLDNIRLALSPGAGELLTPRIRQQAPQAPQVAKAGPLQAPQAQQGLVHQVHQGHQVLPAPQACFQPHMSQQRFKQASPIRQQPAKMVANPSAPCVLKPSLQVRRVVYAPAPGALMFPREVYAAPRKAPYLR